MVVQLNLNAMNYSRRIDAVSNLQAKSFDKISYEHEINKAPDAAAGLSISGKMKKQAENLENSATNAQESVSAVQVADEALSKVQSKLERMYECAVEASDETKSKEDRDILQSEIEELVSEIDHIAENTKFKDGYLLKGAEDKVVVGKEYAMTYPTIAYGENMDYAALAFDYEQEENNARVEKNKYSYDSEEYNEWDRREAYCRSRKLECKKLEQVNEKEALHLELHAGSDADNTNKVAVDIKAMDTKSLGLVGINVSDETGLAASEAADKIANALSTVSEQRASLGEAKNQVEESVSSLDKGEEDTDMVEKMMESAKKNILAQANQAMMAQANQMTQSVMMLLQ